MAQMAEVESALAVMMTTSDTSQRQNADKWLQDFQSSPAAWQVSLGFVTATDKPINVRIFGATVLTNKLRGGSGGGLAPADITGLRHQVIGALASIAAGPLRSQCCRAWALEGPGSWCFRRR